MTNVEILKKKLKAEGYQFDLDYLPRRRIWVAVIWRMEWLGTEWARDEDEFEALRQAYELALQHKEIR